MSEFADKIRTIGFVSCRPNRRAVSVTDDDGKIVGVEIVDGFGNSVTEYVDRQDVTIRTATVQSGSSVLETS